MELPATRVRLGAAFDDVAGRDVLAGLPSRAPFVRLTSTRRTS
jgi:hypothetical protein